MNNSTAGGIELGGQAFMPEVLPKLERLRAAFPHKALEPREQSPLILLK